MRSMKRRPFNFRDLETECAVDTGHRRLDGRTLGARIRIPEALRGKYPYNASAYTFLQELRGEIREFGLLEFPGLPVNRTNHTVAQRAPCEHGYSPNPYLTDLCQAPHQDTPPYPTAWWLNTRRQYFATWLVSNRGLQAFLGLSRREPDLTMEAIHRQLVAPSLDEGRGLLVNCDPGLTIVDNSGANALYHARTCRFDALPSDTEKVTDSPMYTFNEIGLLHYMNSLDIRRGEHDRDTEDLAQVRAFLDEEGAVAGTG